MATKRIRLTRLWDGHPAGEVVEEQDFTVDSMVRKGYGVEIPAHPKPPDRNLEVPANPPVETAMLTPAAETATTGPQASKRKPKNGARATEPSTVTPQNKES